MNLGMLISNLGTSPQTVGEVTNVSDADSSTSFSPVIRVPFINACPFVNDT